MEPDNSTKWDVMMWMDHRAGKQAEIINKLNHPVLGFVGGKISLEMQTPKLKWIKENQPEIWKQAGHFFDLSDFLTFKATGGSLKRSLCSTVCKWTYEVEMSGKVKGWNRQYFDQIGLADLTQENFNKLGTDIIR